LVVCGFRPLIAVPPVGQKLFRRAGSMAVLTASSKWLNSTSVIAPSEFESAGILTVRIAIVPPKTTDAPLQFMIESF
jgi:hypothetical protein